MDISKISLSGFDSGGVFAIQFHVAFSMTIMGAGIAAGGKLFSPDPAVCKTSYTGPSWCAKGNYTAAHSQCMSTTAGAQVEDYVNKDA